MNTKFTKQRKEFMAFLTFFIFFLNKEKWKNKKSWIHERLLFSRLLNISIVPRFPLLSRL